MLKGIELEDFFKAYYQCRRKKRTTINAISFEVNYSDNLVELYNEVNSKKYKIGKSIAFIVTRPKPREVFAADFRDRVIHHVIIQRLEPLFEEEFIDDSYSCRTNKGTLYGIQRLHDKIKDLSKDYTEDIWIGKFDISGFFMNINRNWLWKKLKEFIIEKYTNEKDKEYLLYLTRKVVLHEPQKNCTRKSDIRLWDRLDPAKSLFTCKPNCGLPIGNLTSQCFANFYFNDFDHWMYEMFNGYYGRYVDDFYVLAKTKKEITRKIKSMENYLKQNYGLELHKKKRYIQRYDKGVKFIGTTVKKDKIRLGNECISNLYSAINRFNHLPATPEVAEEFVQTLNSYFGFLRHGDTKWKRKKIWEKIYPLKWRKSNILWIDKDYTHVKINPSYTRKNKQTKFKSYEDIFEEDFSMFWQDSAG